MAMLKYLKPISRRTDSIESETDLIELKIKEEMKKASSKKRGKYTSLSQEDKAKVAKYASENGVPRALRNFKEMELKGSSVRDWKMAYEKALKDKRVVSAQGDDLEIKSLPTKKRGRPPLLGDQLDKKLQEKIVAMRARGAPISTTIVVGIARGLQLKHKTMQADCEVTLCREWARSVLRRMGYSKRRGSSTSKVLPKEFLRMKEQFLIDIKLVVKFEEIPEQLIIDWDQTAVKLVPSASWTMEKRGSKRVEISAQDDKRQITAVFACTLSGAFLPVQLIYKGTTPRCLPAVTFPSDWHLTYSSNHWSNEGTMVEYIKMIIIPYVAQTRVQLKLSSEYPALVIFDVFKGQCTESIYKLLDENNIFHILVPANCTDKLQPLDLSVNKPAKEQMRYHFQEWYGKMICTQLDNEVQEIVDMRLSIMKPLSAKWFIKTCEYLQSNPSIIVNGFHAAGIVDILN